MHREQHITGELLISIPQSPCISTFVVQTNIVAPMALLTNQAGLRIANCIGLTQAIFSNYTVCIQRTFMANAVVVIVDQGPGP
jgi:hypothetical protein